MAADASNYNGKRLSHMLNDVVTDHHEALWLGLTAAEVKERFYLDYVMPRGEDGSEGFIGGCYLGSPNYEMHNTTRLGTLKLMAESSPSVWQEYRLFWDGGLNTKGKANSLEGRSALELGGIFFSARYIAAYYVGISIFLQVREQGETTWQEAGNVRSITSGQTFDEDDRFWNIKDIYPSFSFGDIYQIRLRVNNSEGDFYTPLININIQAYLIKMRRGSSPADAYASTTLYDVYPNTENLDIGTILYEDANGSIPYTAGYFMEELTGIWYLTNTFGAVTNKGIYSPVAELVYSPNVSRLSTGIKLGDYIVELTIANTNTSGSLTTEICSIVVGKVINTSNPITISNLTETTSYSFPSVIVSHSDSSYRSVTDESEEPYEDYTFGWVFVKSSIETANGTF